MSLALPAALWGLLLLPVVVLLRLLARRPRVVVVPSLIPWRNAASASLADRRRGLIFDLPLLLQLVAVSAAVLAAAGPNFETLALPAREVVVVVDNSASMAAPTRYQRAQTRVREELDALGGDVTGSLWVTAPEARRLAGPGASRSELREALLGARPIAAAGDLVAAVSVARREAGPGALLIVAGDDLRPLANLDAREVVLLRVGKPVRNLGIVAVAVEGRRVFCALRNASSREEQVGVELKVGKVTRRLTRKVAPGGRAGFTFELPLARGRFASLELKLSPATDDLISDNRVDVSLRPEPRPVVVAPKGRSLIRTEKAFAALGFPTAVRVEPGEIPDDARLVLSLGQWPERVPANGFTAVIDPPKGMLPGSGIQATEKVGAADVELAGGEYFPHAGGLKFSIDAARELVLAPGAEALLKDGSRVLIALSVDKRALVLAFDPEKTEWVKHASFPVFFERLVAGVPALSNMRRTAFRTGEKAPSGFSGRLTAPSGRTVQPGEAFSETGLYRAAGKPVLAVNLLSDTETTCRVAGDELRRVSAAAPRVERSVALASWLLGLALLCLAAEWFLAWRGRD
jgi:Aerotolerance regulator N-terminal/von Willebrand factor type A domain